LIFEFILSPKVQSVCSHKVLRILKHFYFDLEVCFLNYYHLLYLTSQNRSKG